MTETTDDDDRTDAARAGTVAPRRMFAVLVVLGVVGILGGLPLNIAVLAQAAPGEPRGPAVAALIVSLLVQIALAALVFVTAGRRLGLDAPALRAMAGRRPWWPTLRAALPLALGVAAGGVVLIVTLDLTVFDAVRRQLDAPQVAYVGHLAASLYGGIVEELLLRAGVMTAIAWLLARIARLDDGPAAAWIVWTSIIVAAVAFGLLHLPATAVMVELTPLVVARAVLLNAPLAVAFGWLTWRRGLDAAMVSHIAADVLLISTVHALG